MQRNLLLSITNSMLLWPGIFSGLFFGLKKQSISGRRILNDNGVIIIIDGVYYDSSLVGKAFRLISDIFIYIMDKKKPQRGYTREINSILPNLSGMPLEKAKEYLNMANFRRIREIDLMDIVNIEKKYIPLRKRIDFRKDYYAICGVK